MKLLTLFWLRSLRSLSKNCNEYFVNYWKCYNDFQDFYGTYIVPQVKFDCGFWFIFHWPSLTNTQHMYDQETGKGVCVFGKFRYSLCVLQCLLQPNFFSNGSSWTVYRLTLCICTAYCLIWLYCTSQFK